MSNFNQVAPSILSNETPMGSLRIDALSRALCLGCSNLGAVYDVWPTPAPALRPVAASHIRGHAFADGGSPVCLPKRRSTIVRLTNSAADAAKAWL
jgi:hypothetical protein